MSNFPSIICIRWTLAWQLPRPKKRAAPCQTAPASSASGGLSLGSCPARRSEHHRHHGPAPPAPSQPPAQGSVTSPSPGGLLLVKLPEHHLHQVDSCLAVAPPDEASIIGIRTAAPCQTARASSASGGLSLARSPTPPRQASIIGISWAASCKTTRATTRASSASRGHAFGCCPHKEASIVGIHWAASSTSTEHHLHQWGRGSTCQARVRIRADFRLAGAPPPSPRPRKHPPKEASITCIGRPEHHLHQVDFRLAGARKRSEHYPHQLGHFFYRCQERSEHHWQVPAQRSEHHRHQLVCFLHRRRHMHQVNSRLASACPSTEANIIGISSVKLPLTREKRAASASSGLLLGRCHPPPTPFQVPPLKSEHQQHRQARASPASGGLLLGSCPARRSEHHRHQEGCSLSNCPSVTCIRWTLAWQLPRPKKRASSASGGLLLVKLPGHHLHQVDSRLAVAPPEEASIIGIRRAAPCQTSRASPASGGLSLGSCPARRSEHHRHQEGCSLSNFPSIICIRWTLAWQLPRPKKRASSASGGLLLVKLPQHHLHQVDSRLAVAPPEEASIIGIRRAAPCQTARASSASGGLSLGSCPARRSEHHRHQEGCSLSNCPSIICIRWTLACQVPPPRQASIIGISWAASCKTTRATTRASSASRGHAFGCCPHKEASIVGIHWAASSTEHHLHQWGRGSTCQARVRIQADFRLAGAPPPSPRPRKHPPPKKRASPASAGPSITCIRWTFVWQVPAKEASIIRISWATSFTDAKREASIIGRCPPKEASIIGISWSASCTGAVICIR